MIDNPQIFKILNKKIISFNEEQNLVFLENEFIVRINYKVKLLGVLKDNLILFVKNKFIIAVDYPSFTLNRILHKGQIETYTASETFIWFLQKNIIYQIDCEMQISQYDHFTCTKLFKMHFLKNFETLAFFTRDSTEMKVCFENCILPTFIFSNISSVPEILFESKHMIILSIGRTIIEYNVQKNKLYELKTPNPIKLKWNSISIIIHYQITYTDIIILLDKVSKTYKLNSDVWKIINTGNEIYLFSDSINTQLCVNKIDSNGIFSKIYNIEKHNYLISLEKHRYLKRFPFLKFFHSAQRSYSAVFFIHGGPHQKAGNLWDPLLAKLIHNYTVYVPQYPGTFGVDKIDFNNYGIEDFKDLIVHYEEIRQLHQKIILIGHSYGAFLGLKLFIKKSADIFIGINGVYDLLTISHLNPKTYAHLNKQEKIMRSPKFTKSNSEKYGAWHHIQFEGDPLIKKYDLKHSLEKVGGEGPIIHYLNFFGHGKFNQIQSLQIVKLIKIIENRFYKSHEHL